MSHSTFKFQLNLGHGLWEEVKKFVLEDQFAKGLLARAKAAFTGSEALEEMQRLQVQLRQTERQIEVLAERIAALPENMDVKPVVSQLQKLQELKVALEEKLAQASDEKPKQDEPVNLESLSAFRKGLRELIKKGEKDFNIQTAIIKKVVHQIIVQPNGFEIHFHVGKTYYEQMPSEDLASGGSFFVPFSLENQKNPRQFSNFFKDSGSSLLTIGGPDPDRTGDLCNAIATLSQLSYRPS